MQRSIPSLRPALLGGVALASALALGAAVGSSPAGSATNSGLTLDNLCVRDSDGSRVNFKLAGFAPNATVDMQQDGSPLATLTMGGDGGFVGSFPASGTGDLFYAERTVSATDGQGSSGMAKYATVDLGVVSKPVSAKPTAKVSYYAQGFVEGGTLYAHYAYSKSETVKQFKKTVALGPLTGPCGTITTKKVTQLPIPKAKKGVWEVQFDTNKDYRRQQGVYFATTVFVPKTLKK